MESCKQYKLSVKILGQNISIFKIGKILANCPNKNLYQLILLVLSTMCESTACHTLPLISNFLIFVNVKVKEWYISMIRFYFFYSVKIDFFSHS